MSFPYTFHTISYSSFGDRVAFFCHLPLIWCMRIPSSISGSMLHLLSFKKLTKHVYKPALHGTKPNTIDRYDRILLWHQPFFYLSNAGIYLCKVWSHLYHIVLIFLCKPNQILITVINSVLMVTQSLKNGYFYICCWWYVLSYTVTECLQMCPQRNILTEHCMAHIYISNESFSLFFSYMAFISHPKGVVWA